MILDLLVEQVNLFFPFHKIISDRLVFFVGGELFCRLFLTMYHPATAVKTVTRKISNIV